MRGGIVGVECGGVSDNSNVEAQINERWGSKVTEQIKARLARIEHAEAQAQQQAQMWSTKLIELRGAKAELIALLRDIETDAPEQIPQESARADNASLQ